VPIDSYLTDAARMIAYKIEQIAGGELITLLEFTEMSVNVRRWFSWKLLATLGITVAMSSMSGLAMAQGHGGHGGGHGGGGHHGGGAGMGGGHHHGGGYSGGHYHGGGYSGGHYHGGYGGGYYGGGYYGGLGGIGLSYGLGYGGLGYGLGTYGYSSYPLGYGSYGLGYGSSYYRSPLYGSMYTSPLNYGYGTTVYASPRVYAPARTYSAARVVNQAPASNVYQGGVDDKGQPVGELRPGMVLPDGAVVVSVGK
jgi:hypothetical protein